MGAALNCGTHPANQADRSMVRGRAFSLATVRGVGPNKAGQPGCSVLLREREDGPWMLIGAAFVTETAMVWDGGVSGVRYRTDSPTGDVDDTLTRCFSRMGALRLGDLGPLVRLPWAMSIAGNCRALCEGLPTRLVSPGRPSPIARAGARRGHAEPTSFPPGVPLATRVYLTPTSRDNGLDSQGAPDDHRMVDGECLSSLEALPIARRGLRLLQRLRSHHKHHRKFPSCLEARKWLLR